MKIPKFESQTELTKYLIENNDLLIAEKKATIKYTDAFCFAAEKTGIATISKAMPQDDDEYKYIQLVANSTNYMDSHDDVHISGLWTKTLKENKNLMFLNSHKMDFENLICKKDNIKAYTKRLNWQELGYEDFGETEALIGEMKIRKNSRNMPIIEMYEDGTIDNHSVGMQYVKIATAINDPNAPQQFEVWNKYFNQIANKQKAIDKGFFFAVTEAKLIEISAVLVGSNDRTPTLNTNRKNSKYNTNTSFNSLLQRLEPANATQSEKAEEEQIVKFLKKLNEKL
jgi:hypothetical protein